jgi:hypothetical protein
LTKVPGGVPIKAIIVNSQQQKNFERTSFKQQFLSSLEVQESMNFSLKRIRRSIQNKRPFKPMINNLILYPAAYVRIWKRKITVNPQGFHVFNIELTNKCPMKCIMCARTHQMTRAQGIMDFELFRRMIDEYVMLKPG